MYYDFYDCTDNCYVIINRFGETYFEIVVELVLRAV